MYNLTFSWYRDNRAVSRSEPSDRLICAGITAPARRIYIMRRKQEGEACLTCGRDELGLLECQDCLSWIVNVRGRDLRRLCVDCAPDSTAMIEIAEVQRLLAYGSLDFSQGCGTCGRDELRFLCCVGCGTEIARRTENGSRFCSDCVTREVRDLARDAADELLSHLEAVA